VEAVGEALAGAAGVAQVSEVAPRRPVRVATAFAPTAGTRNLIKLDNPVMRSSAPSAAQT
jgi:hypothetical protein